MGCHAPEQGSVNGVAVLQEPRVVANVSTTDGTQTELKAVKEGRVAASSKHPVLKASKPRIDCIDGARFALVFPIIIGHFIKFGTKNEVLLKLLTQENVLVGGFFIISGYVSAYVSTKLGELDYDHKKLARPELFFWQKVMGYYPLHFLVSTLFAPMFVVSDMWMKRSASTAGFHGFLNYSLLQAWFPAAAEIWNPPTWFLSSLTFCNLAMPSVVLPQVARLSREGLRKLLACLGVLAVMQKVSYSQAWKFHCRGGYRCKTDTPHLWNLTRFHPMWALVEVTMGIAAARSVMLDDDAERQRAKGRENPLFYFAASHLTLALRLTKRFNFNDAMVRSTLFVPLYTKFLTSMHRDRLSDSPSGITCLLGSSMMTRLGALAFPMFILHGPIGQLFYKKAVATRLWGRVMPEKFFPAYLLLVLVAGHLANEGFVKNKTVQRLSGRVAHWLADRTEGMLQDRSRQTLLEKGKA